MDFSNEKFSCLQVKNIFFSIKYAARYSCSVWPGVGTSIAFFCKVTRSITVEYPHLADRKSVV